MSKIIFKMTFKHPNLSDTTSKNISHVGYIATRAGVDKTITESDLKKELEKGIEQLASDDEGYLKYMDERPRSHGLFGKDGIEDPDEVQKEIAQVNSFVWRGIISLKEEDAKQLGYLDKEKWQDMLRKKIPDMADKMDIRTTNLRWTAAIHMEKGHPHAHVMFWEKTPEKTIGIVKAKTLDDIRKLYTDEIFEEERLQLLNDKNLMRDLLRDLAKDDVSKATKLVKEVRELGKDLKSFIGGTESEGVMPRLYSEEEEYIAEKIQALGEMLPGKGRMNLKFMPEHIKEEIRAIADYLLKQPEFSASVEKNLKSVKELTKMYTGKEEDIQKARDNAYNDIRDRLSQIILKGAAESQKENIFYVDTELSQKAVDFIKNLNTQINLIPEQTKVLNEICTALIRINNTDEEISKQLLSFMEKENITYPKELIDNLIKEKRNNESNNQDLNSLSNKKKVDYYLSVLKLSGCSEEEAFKTIKATIKNDSQELDNKLQELKEGGTLKIVDGQYKLTNKGIEEFLKTKNLDRAEKEILKMLETDESLISKVNFKEMLENKDVFSNLHDKDPEEFKVGKYDIKVREEFGESNILTFKGLEQKIYDKYTDEELNINTDKAEMEIELLEKRIEKLTLNGYVKFDRASGVYSFTNEGIEAISNVDDKMEFTRYDAKVTLSYIDKAESNILTENELKEVLAKEIINQTAKNYYESFNSLLESKQTEGYINISETGDLTSTDEGKFLGRELNQFNKYFFEGKGKITNETLKNLCDREFGDNANKQFNHILKNLDKQVEKGNIDKNINTGVYTVNPVCSDINKFLYQIYKAGGKINKENLKEVLEKNIPNKEATNQFKYLIKRLDNLKTEGYLKGKDKEYILNEKGIEKREDLLVPQRNLLRDKLKYLTRLGLLDKEDEEYHVTEKYYKYMKNIAISKEENTLRESNVLTKDIAAILDRTQDKVKVGKIERTNERIATGKYVNGEYGDIKTDYESIRSACNVQDTIGKTVNNLSTTLLVSGVSLEETKEILCTWNKTTNSNIDKDKINEIVDKVHETVKENNLWGQTTIISSKDWREMFENLNIKETEIPKWIYKGENWKAFNSGLGMASLANDIWKSVWKQLERQRMQVQSQAEHMKKQLIKQQASSQNKSAIVEQIKKNKDRGSLSHGDDFEI